MPLLDRIGTVDFLEYAAKNRFLPEKTANGTHILRNSNEPLNLRL
jgi:hypothetical protein